VELYDSSPAITCGLTREGNGVGKLLMYDP
jgi:hypothetical protein